MTLTDFYTWFYAGLRVEHFSLFKLVGAKGSGRRLGNQGLRGFIGFLWFLRIWRSLLLWLWNGAKLFLIFLGGCIPWQKSQLWRDVRCSPTKMIHRCLSAVAFERNGRKHGSWLQGQLVLDVQKCSEWLSMAWPVFNPYEKCIERMTSDNPSDASSTSWWSSIWWCDLVKSTCFNWLFVSPSHRFYKNSMYFWLVVWTPLKNISQLIGMIIPNIWENRKCYKPPTRFGWYPILVTVHPHLAFAMLCSGCSSTAFFLGLPKLAT